MPPKRKKSADMGQGATIDTVQPMTRFDDNPSTKSSGLKTSLHGNVFQLKLLMLFLIRGIRAKYKFKLGTEISKMGGKFDDLIFKYEVLDEGVASMAQEVPTERCRYLQAKHKKNEERGQITAADLLNDNEGEFSLPKYFRSYYREVINGIQGCPPENVQDCIICTNIGFEDEMKLKESGIELLRLNDMDDILTFDVVPPHIKSPTRYRLKKTEALRREMEQWSEIHILARTLLKYAIIEKETLTLRSSLFNNYHFALIKEKIIDKREGKTGNKREGGEGKTGKLCADFLKGNSSSRFREILSDVTFIHYWDKLKFKYDNNKKIRVADQHRNKLITQFQEMSLEKLLPQYPQIKTETMEMDFRIFEDFYEDLVSEKVIDVVGERLKRKPFTKNFIQGKDLSEKVSQFRGKLRNTVFIHLWKDLTFQLSETFGRKKINSLPDENKPLNALFDVNREIDDFLDKLVFAVHTPNEVELDAILKMEVSDRYNLNESDFQSDYILRNMLDWFKMKESNFKTSQEGVEILENGKKKMESLRVTAVSIDYQRQLKGVCGFNEESVREMADKLKRLLTSENQTECISTQLPKLTAVKVISALKELKQSANAYCQRKDSYLITSLTRLQKDRSKLENALKAEHSHHLIIVVCDEETFDESDQFPLTTSLTQENQSITIKKKIIIISRVGGGLIDDLKFTNLSNKSKTALLSTEILFQGALQTVRTLILRESDTTIDDSIVNDVIDLNSMEELMKKAKKDKIVIPSYSSTRFEKSLYIKRRLISSFPLDDLFWRELVKELGDKYSLEKIQNECRISGQGKINWHLKDEKDKFIIWQKIISVIEKRNLLPKSQCYNCPIPEDQLNMLPRVVIVSGVAGSGKSTILSHYYEQFKDKKLDHWAIIINLTDHSEAFFELKSETSLNKLSALDFLVHLSVVDDSSFSRGLLRHRLETGDRIEIMLDGFDESHYQEIVIQMINAIKQTKMNRIFVTTRTHMASRLQFKLSQLTYCLENFSPNDQIKYLTSLWKRDMKPEFENRLRQFAESVVERVSTTLNDQDRDFIGIPLQCRILADCFQSEVQEAAQQGSTFDSLFKMINEIKFNLANLYRLLMDKKREIYRQEKVKAQDHNHLVKSHIEEDMKYLNSYLRTLAIETIVSTKEHVDTLLGRQKQPLQSDAEQNEVKETRTDHSVRFGLLDTNAKGQVKFLHRTYPEFLMAEYLYNGFLLDEKCRNKLLDNESIRKLLINKIFAKVQYDGVQVFINSMLKEIVDEDKEWHAKVVQSQLPERLFKFSEVLFSQFLRQIRKPYSRKHPNALLFSAQNRKEKIFKFLCDCLDATFDKSDVLRAMTISFLSEFLTENYTFTLKVFCQSSEVFERFIGYYDSEHANGAVPHFQDGTTHVQTFIEKIFHGLPISGLEDSYWNGEEQQYMIKRLLDFMDKNPEAAELFFQPWKEYYMEPLFSMLVFNKNYEHHLITFLNILSNTNAYSNESTLANLTKNICSSVLRKNRKGERFVKILDILSEKRKILATKLYGLVFSVEPEAFKTNFQPCLAEICNKETDDSLLNFLLERDSFCMTPLHRAAFNNETDAIEKILSTIQKNATNEADEERKNAAERVLNVMCYDENGFTPFYVAAARGHEIVYNKMLFFLKDFYEKQKAFEKLENNLSATNGFVYHALSDAMESENLEMFKVILNAIKNILGQKCLLNLLKSNSRENKSQNRYVEQDFWSDTILGVASRYKELFQMLVKIVVQKDTSEDYQDWNNLVFHLLETEGFNRFTFKYVNAEILQGMLSQNFNNWTTRLLEIDISFSFEVLSKRLIKNFLPDQLRDLIKTITSLNKIHSENCCFWCQFLNRSVFLECLDDDHEISKFLKLISEKIGESFVYKLVIHYNENSNTIRSKTLVNFLLTHLSKERQKQANQHWKKNSSKTINDTFFTPTSKSFWLIDTRKDPSFFKDIMWFFLDYGSDAQLRRFVETITSLHNIGKKQRSMWSYLFEEDQAANKIILHVSKKTDIFGGDAAKTLLFHDVDENPHYLNAVWKKDVDELLAQLPEVVQEGIRQYIQQHSYGLIEKIFENPNWLLAYDQSYTILNTLTFVVNHSNENQLQRFIQHIKIVREDPLKNRSIWYGSFRPDFKDDYIKLIGKFLESVLKIFGSSVVKGLLLHADERGNNDDGAFIFCFVLCGEEKVVETMLSYLDESDRENVQRKVNKYLDNKFNQIPKRNNANKISKDLFLV